MTTEQETTRTIAQAPASSIVADPDSILAQLEKILASPAFCNSKRYPRFLKFVVEQALLGHADRLKERLLGIEVFDRVPDYDLATDPIVRVAAGEIRKRLAQYYVEYGHESELRIHLQPGSYVPEFHVPRPSVSAVTAEDGPSPAAIAAPYTRRVRSFILSHIKIITALFASAGLAAALCFYFVNLSTPVERFWKPILKSSSSPLICLGDISSFLQERSTAANSGLRTGVKSNDYLSLGDVEAMNRVSENLVQLGKRVTVSNSASTSFADLRRQPVVLIGGRTNQWAMRSMQFLRYQLVVSISPGVNGIRDRQDPSHIRWMVDFNVPFDTIQKTYGIIARFTDPETGQPTVLVEGLGARGTMASAEFLTTSAYLKEFIDKAPRGWQDRNIEIVLETQMVNGDNGPPHVIAIEAW